MFLHDLSTRRHQRSGTDNTNRSSKGDSSGLPYSLKADVDQSNSLPGAAKRYERQRGAEETPRSWGRRSGDELRASSLRPSGEEERVVWSRQFPASWGPLGIRVSGSTESSTSPLDKCVRVARVSAQLRSVCSLLPRGLPGSRREGALCQGPRSLAPPSPGCRWESSVCLGAYKENGYL